MEKSDLQPSLYPFEQDYARERFGNLPEPILASRLMALYTEIQTRKYGSPEAAAVHHAIVMELEDVMVAALNESEARFRRL